MTIRKSARDYALEIVGFLQEESAPDGMMLIQALQVRFGTHRWSQFNSGLERAEAEGWVVKSGSWITLTDAGETAEDMNEENEADAQAKKAMPSEAGESSNDSKASGGKATDFLTFGSFISAARNAHPAFRYAVVIAGILAIVGTFAHFGVNYATLIFGAIAILVLMTFFLVFSQAVQLAHSSLALPAQVAVWAFLILVIIAASGLLSSAFLNVPLPFKDWIIREMGFGFAQHTEGEPIEQKKEGQTQPARIFSCTITDPLIKTFHESHKAQNNHGLDDYRIGLGQRWKADLEAQGHRNVVVKILPYGAETRDHGDYVYDLNYEATMDGSPKYGPDPRCKANEPPPGSASAAH